jgi:hypothetical protein
LKISCTDNRVHRIEKRKSENRRKAYFHELDELADRSVANAFFESVRHGEPCPNERALIQRELECGRADQGGAIPVDAVERDLRLLVFVVVQVILVVPEVKRFDHTCVFVPGIIPVDGFYDLEPQTQVDDARVVMKNEEELRFGETRMVLQQGIESGANLRIRDLGLHGLR